MGEKRTSRSRRQEDERNDLLLSLVTAIEDYAIYLLDADGSIATWNAGAQRLKGYDAEEIVGRHFSAFYPPEDTAAGKPETLLEAAARDGRSEDEGWRVRKDGSRFWANVVITAIRADDGRLRGFGKVTRDLSEPREREQALHASRDELQTAARELERSNKDLEHFAFAASHDLQQPLRQIVGFSQLLTRRAGAQLDGSSHEYLDFITAGVERMQTLIGELLRFSRVGTGQLNVSDVDLELVVGQAVADLQTTIAETHAQVSASGLPHVNGDAALLTLVFQNLIANAVKFADDAPQVSLDAERSNGHWLIHCVDNGIGIAAADAERVFGAFERLHAQEAYAGTGLGLATCRKIVERHGGRIWVEPTPEGQRGARVTVELPA